jgi:hypothetical protein
MSTCMLDTWKIFHCALLTMSWPQFLITNCVNVTKLVQEYAASNQLLVASNDYIVCNNKGQQC